MAGALALLVLALQLPFSQLAFEQHDEQQPALQLAMKEQMSYGPVMPGLETLGEETAVNLIHNELHYICTWQNLTELHCICTWQNLMFAFALICCMDCVVTFYKCSKLHKILPAKWVGRRRFAVKTKRKTFWWWMLLALICIGIPVLRTWHLLAHIRKKHTGLNGKLSGGGRKEEHNLLQGLQLLLQQHSQQAPVEPPPSKQEDVETRLLAALKSLVERASKKPDGLLDRLRNLVDQAAKGHFRGPSQSKKRRRKREKAQTNQTTGSNTTVDRTSSKRNPQSTVSKNTVYRAHHLPCLGQMSSNGNRIR